MDNIVSLILGIVAIFVGFGGFFCLYVMAKEKAPVWSMLIVLALSSFILFMGMLIPLISASVISGLVETP